MTAPTRTVTSTTRRQVRCARSRTKSDLPHHGVSNQRTAMKAMRRKARKVDPRMNSLWMLTIRATTASIVSSTRKRFGLNHAAAGWPAAPAGRRATSAPWVTSWPTSRGWEPRSAARRTPGRWRTGPPIPAAGCATSPARGPAAERRCCRYGDVLIEPRTAFRRLGRPALQQLDWRPGRARPSVPMESSVRSVCSRAANRRSSPAARTRSPTRPDLLDTGAARGHGDHDPFRPRRQVVGAHGRVEVSQDQGDIA